MDINDRQRKGLAKDCKHCPGRVLQPSFVFKRARVNFSVAAERSARSEEGDEFQMYR